jgi:hypothetical protein
MLRLRGCQQVSLAYVIYFGQCLKSVFLSTDCLNRRRESVAQLAQSKDNFCFFPSLGTTEIT